METVRQRLILHHAIDRKITLDQAAQVFEDAREALENGAKTSWNQQANYYPNPLYAAWLILMRSYPVKNPFSYLFHPDPEDGEKWQFSHNNERFENCIASEGCTGQIKTWDLFINGERMGKMCNLSLYQETHSESCPIRKIVFVKYDDRFNKLYGRQTNNETMG